MSFSSLLSSFLFPVISQAASPICTLFSPRARRRGDGGGGRDPRAVANLAGSGRHVLHGSATSRGSAPSLLFILSPDPAKGGVERWHFRSQRRRGRWSVGSGGEPTCGSARPSRLRSGGHPTDPAAASPCGSDFLLHLPSSRSVREASAAVRPGPEGVEAARGRSAEAARRPPLPPTKGRSGVLGR